MISTKLPPNRLPVSSLQKTASPYAPLTMEVMQQHNNQQPGLHESPNHTADLKKAFDTLDITLSSQVQKMLAQDQIETSPNEYTNAVSSSVAPTDGKQTIYPHNDSQAVLFVPDHKYHKSRSRYAQSFRILGSDLAGVGAQFDSSQYLINANLAYICDASADE